MKDKHTPGPWKVTDDGCIYFKDGFIGEAYQFNPGLYGEKQEDAPMMANAKLIAAAPEMYDLLKSIYPMIGKKGHAIIDKIEGDE